MGIPEAADKRPLYYISDKPKSESRPTTTKADSSQTTSQPQPTTKETKPAEARSKGPDYTLSSVPEDCSSKRCMDVRGEQTKGTAVLLHDCDGSGGQQWELERDNTAVKLRGTAFCLDAGSDPKDGTPLTDSTCYVNAPSQIWSLSSDGHLKLKNSELCVDVRNGNTDNDSELQLWECAEDNKNQVWSYALD